MAFRSPTPPADVVFRRERDDDDEIDAFIARIIGGDRRRRPSYLFRDGLPHRRDLSHIARRDGRLVGVVRFWDIGVGSCPKPHLLLGPLVVEPELKGRGVGQTLMRRALNAIATEADDDRAVAPLRRAPDAPLLILLIGDLDYYRRFGFAVAERGRFGFPQPHDPDRLLARIIGDETQAAPGGTIRRWDPSDAPSRAKAISASNPDAKPDAKPDARS